MQDAQLIDRHGAVAFLANANMPFSVGTLDKLRSTGGGPTFVKLGGRVRYRIADLNEWIASRTHVCRSTADHRGQSAA
ncbi:MAG: helix-turn-helix transcriptional regulator [Hyphomicrobium sp.]|jgi:hypothetical protein